MNSITISGNLTRTAEVRYLANGDAVTVFAVADNQYGDKGAIFWNCSFFGARGEKVAPYLLKGGQVTVIGTLSERDWTDKDGMKRKSIDVRVTDLALQGGSQERTNAPARTSAQEPAQKPAQASPVASGSGFDDMDSDIPF